MVDSFKRPRAAQNLAEVSTLQCKILTQASPREAKIAMYLLKQVQIAQALGRHKTWVCRRLQFVERLATRAQEDIRVGLLSPTVARERVKLPRGNQKQLLDTIVQEGLSSREGQIAT